MAKPNDERLSRTSRFSTSPRTNRTIDTFAVASHTHRRYRAQPDLRRLALHAEAQRRFVSRDRIRARREALPDLQKDMRPELALPSPRLSAVTDFPRFEGLSVT